MSELVYYAQNREDVILKGFFPDVKKGFYVDVGASDPNHFSVTKLFYEMGWTGINIDANATLVHKLEAYRPNDLNLNVGVSDKNGTLSFREYIGHGLSTFSDEIKKDYAQHSQADAVNLFTDYEVRVRTLSEILSEAQVKSIHFLKVDVEGFEYEVLAGNDWKKFRPQVICIEANHIVKDWKKILTNNDYLLVFFDGLNEYYVSNESGRQSTFNYVDAVISTQPRYVQTQETLELLEREISVLENEIIGLEHELHIRDDHIYQLGRIKVMVRNLYNSLNGALEAQLRPHKAVGTQYVEFPELNIETNPKRDQLLRDLHLYDGMVYRKKDHRPVDINAGTLKRVLWFLFRTIRFITKRTAKISLEMIARDKA